MNSQEFSSNKRIPPTSSYNIRAIFIPLTWQAGRMMQGIWPRNHWPVKLVMGVRGAAVRHITMSDTAMLHTNRFMPVCSVGVLDTEKDMDAAVQKQCNYPLCNQLKTKETSETHLNFALPFLLIFFLAIMSTRQMCT